jgi:uncharacterized protein
MLRNIIRVLAVMAFFSLAAGNAFAVEPTLHQVYQAAEAGNYAAAQAMMDQVLRVHPNSAKAHFVEAELLAKQRRLAQAQTELATAERLEPGLAFAKPGAIEELKALLSAPQNLGGAGVYRAPASTGSNFPWGIVLLGIGLIAFVLVVVRMMRQRANYAGQSPMIPNYGGGVVPGQPYGPSPAGPMAATGGGMGSGIMGGLATGAAVGVGMVAGEALMHRVLDGQHTEGGALAADTGSWDRAQPQSDMGGEDFGVADGGSWDDNSSIGGGGDDWS